MKKGQGILDKFMEKGNVTKSLLQTKFVNPVSPHFKNIWTVYYFNERYCFNIDFPKEVKRFLLQQ